MWMKNTRILQQSRTYLHTCNNEHVTKIIEQDKQIELQGYYIDFNTLTLIHKLIKY